MQTPTLDQLKLHAEQLVTEAQTVDSLPIKETASNLSRYLMKFVESPPEHELKILSVAIQKAYRHLNLVRDNKPVLDHLSNAVLEFYLSPIASQRYAIESETESVDQVAQGVGAETPDALASQDAEENSQTGSDTSPPASPKAQREAHLAFLKSSAGVMMQKAVRNAISQLKVTQINSMFEQLKTVSSYDENPTAFHSLTPQHVQNLLDQADVDTERLAINIVSLLRRSPIRTPSLADKSGLELRCMAIEGFPSRIENSPNADMSIYAKILFDIPECLHVSLPDFNAVQSIRSSQQIQAKQIFDFVNKAFGWEEDLCSDPAINKEALQFTYCLFDTVGGSGSTGLLPEDDVFAMAENLLLTPNLDQLPDSRLNRAYVQVRGDLQSKFGEQFSETQIQNAIRKCLPDCLRAIVAGGAGDKKTVLQNKFLAHFILNLKHGESTQPSHISPEKVNDLIKTLESKQVLSEKGGFLPVDVLGKVDMIVFNPPPVLARKDVKKSQQMGLPETNANMPLISQRGERFRMSFLAQTLAGPTEELAARINSSQVSLIGSDSAIKRVADSVVVSKPDSALPKLTFKLNDEKKQRLVDVEMNSVAMAVASGKETGHVDDYLQGFFKAQLANSGVDLRRYDRVAYRSVHSSPNKLRLSDKGAGGLLTNGLFSKTSKLSMEEKASKRAEKASKKRVSGLVKRGTEGGNISKKWDRSFVNYMAYQQSLWKSVKPEIDAGPLLTKAVGSEQVDFPLLQQIGFNQKNLSRESLIKMGQLVVSAVGAKTFRQQVSNASVTELYGDVTQVNGGLPLSAEDFAANLLGRKGKVKKDDTWTHGTLGSQVIDWIAELNRDPNAPLLPRQHQMMGNLLSLMMRHAHRENGSEVPAVATSTSGRSVPSRSNPLLNGSSVRQTVGVTSRSFTRTTNAPDQVIDESQFEELRESDEVYLSEVHRGREVLLDKDFGEVGTPLREIVESGFEEYGLDNLISNPDFLRQGNRQELKGIIKATFDASPIIFGALASNYFKDEDKVNQFEANAGVSKSEFVAETFTNEILELVRNAEVKRVEFLHI